MKRAPIRAAILTVCCLWGGAAQAYTYGDYKALRNTDSSVGIAMLNLIADSFGLANAVLLYRGQPALYCTEERFNGYGYERILLDYVALGEPADEARMELLLLEALTDKYPC